LQLLQRLVVGLHFLLLSAFLRSTRSSARVKLVVAVVFIIVLILCNPLMLEWLFLSLSSSYLRSVSSSGCLFSELLLSVLFFSLPFASDLFVLVVTCAEQGYYKEDLWEVFEPRGIKNRVSVGFQRALNNKQVFLAGLHDYVEIISHYWSDLLIMCAASQCVSCLSTTCCNKGWHVLGVELKQDERCLKLFALSSLGFCCLDNKHSADNFN
jgi:hypothetical protein